VQLQPDLLIVGGGQAALATAFYLRRTALTWAILDDQPAPGGAWRHTWKSLRLFSPAQWSSLPGWLMPRGRDEYPTRDEAIDYLTRYEERYAFPVERPVHVSAVTREGDTFRVDTSAGPRYARAIVSATGTWSNPVVPEIPGRESFRGLQLHSAHYSDPEPLSGLNVAIVGGGNSAAQILAEVSPVASTTWVTLADPAFLPDDVDGRVLFTQATARYNALREGREPPPVRSLGDIVMVERVREARARGVLHSRRMFTRMTHDGVVWPDGSESSVDAVIWCTGFRAALSHLEPLGVVESGRVATVGTRSVREPMLWLVGYGEWTGYASATLIGVGRSARATVEEIVTTFGSK
jgi:putative flavoprotein involved in K+ transport